MLKESDEWVHERLWKEESEGVNDISILSQK